MALDRGPEMGSGVERLNKTIFFSKWEANPIDFIQ